MSSAPLPGRHSFGAVVLAGGASRRMGTDKALLDVDGEPLAVRVARTAVASGAEQVVVAGGSDELVSLLSTLDLEVAVTHVPDLAPGEGPLSGTVSGIRALDAFEDVLVVACDLPRLAVTPIHDLLAARRSTNAELAVPLVEGHRQWHCVVWSHRSFDVLATAMAAGERSLRGAAAPLSQCVTVTTNNDWLTDLDTPADVASFTTGSATQIGTQ